MRTDYEHGLRVDVIIAGRKATAFVKSAVEKKELLYMMLASVRMAESLSGQGGRNNF